jgi:hypothetical protein
MTGISPPQSTRFNRNPFSNSGDKTRGPTDIHHLSIILSFYVVCIHSLWKTPNSALNISFNRHNIPSLDFKINLCLPSSNDDLMLIRPSCPIFKFKFKLRRYKQIFQLEFTPVKGKTWRNVTVDLSYTTLHSHGTMGPKYILKYLTISILLIISTKFDFSVGECIKGFVLL